MTRAKHRVWPNCNIELSVSLTLVSPNGACQGLQDRPSSMHGSNYPSSFLPLAFPFTLLRLLTLLLSLTHKLKEEATKPSLYSIIGYTMPDADVNDPARKRRWNCWNVWESGEKFMWDLKKYTQQKNAGVKYFL